MILTAAALLPLAACGDTDPSGNGERKDIRLSTKQTGFVNGGNDFAFRFMAGVDASVKEDFVISPLSMQFLLGMLLNGADGETAVAVDGRNGCRAAIKDMHASSGNRGPVRRRAASERKDASPDDRHGACHSAVGELQRAAEDGISGQDGVFQLECIAFVKTADISA